jgi:adenylate cyclase class 2
MMKSEKWDGMMGTDQELEVKFYISKRKELEERLIALGGQLKEPRVHEVNLRFDTSDMSLMNTGRLLRLRNDSRARLTYKGLGRIEGGARLRQELEFTVSNFDTARALFEALGYEVYMMYEKFRTTYKLENLEVVVDEMPYGDFLEIEGPDGESIQAAAQRLEINWNARILDSYTVLFEYTRAQLGFDFRDLSFENFKGLTVTTEALGVLIADLS